MKYFYLFVLFSVSLSTSAAERSTKQMEVIAKQKLFNGYSRAMAEGHVTSIREIVRNSTYSIYANDYGTVVVSADDRFPEIIGYSENVYDGNNLPPAFVWWLKATEETMSASKKASSLTVKPQGSVESFIVTKWGQEDPYNFLCPSHSNGKYLTGCVATALSQVLYYYKYPAQGHGKGYYTIGGNSLMIPYNIQGVYEWDLMQPVYSSSYLSDEKKRAISQLMVDAGAAVLMDYSLGASGTHTLETASALADNFDYDENSIKYAIREFYSQDEWMKLIYDELNNKAPIIYAASDPASGGHAFVLDGYDEEGLVHVNWGWDGEMDGYYDVSLLNPTGHSYSMQQRMVLGIRPFKTEGTVEANSLFGTQGSITLKSTMAKSLTFEFDEILYNLGYRDFDGRITLNIVNADDSSNSIEKILYETNGSVMPPMYGINLNSVFVRDQNIQPNSTYRVYLASRSYTEARPSICRSTSGKIEFEIKTDSKGKVVDIVTSIDCIKMPVSNSTRVFSLDGRCLGSSTTALTSGIYILNGQKVVVK